MSHRCYITIDNCKNSKSLELISLVDSSGRYSKENPSTIQVEVGAVIPAGTVFSFELESDILFAAGAQMTWFTGAAGSGAILDMAFKNALLGNEVSFGVDCHMGSSLGKKTYGVSYFSATEGDEPTLSRDFINPTGSGHTPLTVVFTVVENCLASADPTSLPLEGITNVVMLMLENRGFDHLLGQLYSVDPANVYPVGSTPPPGNSTVPNPINFDGLHNNPDFSNCFEGYTLTASPVTGTVDIPSVDPGEQWKDTNQQLFDHKNDPAPGEKPTMNGFLANYAAQPTGPNISEILSYYTKETLPVLHDLATSYAISDAWYCSVPSQTSPNRGFSLAGTSEGYVDNYKDPGIPNLIEFIPESVRFGSNTLFNIFSQCGMNDWKIYYQDSILGHSMTETLFKKLSPYRGTEHIESFEVFAETIRNCGTLPRFTYLEPSWYTFFPTGSVANDYHPPYNVCPGEQNLAAVYKLLTEYKDWDTTLFIVTFDEHGGTFDHAAPPATIAPDGLRDWSKFDFERLGLRVPTLLISPRIAKSTVFRSPDPEIHFDHTSFLKTLLAWQGIDITGGALGKRAAQAPCFSGVLSNTVVNPGEVPLHPNVCPVSWEDRLINDLERFLFPKLALQLCGDVSGSEKHEAMTKKLRSFKYQKELEDFIHSTR